MARKSVALDDITYKDKKYFIGQTVYVDKEDVDKLVKMLAIQPVEEKKKEVINRATADKKYSKRYDIDADEDVQNQPERKKFSRIKE